jgi:serine/threonine protein kinase
LDFTFSCLHQIASAHPGVVTLHHIVEHLSHTYHIMDYALDHSRKLSSYLGDDALIKDISLQLLDAADYCHTLGIYRRDLKPENVLCFDDGQRVVITDFGLVTTEKVSR